MTPFDVFISIIPALATLAFSAGVLRATTTMAPPVWSYWLPVVFAACCLALPFRYGPGFIPDDTTLLGSPRAFMFDLMLQGSFSAVAAGLSMRAVSVGKKASKFARIILMIALAVCLFIFGFEVFQILQDRNAPDSISY